MAPRLLRGAYLIPPALLVVADLNIVIAASNARRYTKRSRKCLIFLFFPKPTLSLYHSNSSNYLTFLPSYLLIFFYSPDDLSKFVSINRMAFSRRGITRSGPKMTIISKIPGLAVFPVNATLTGWAILPSLSPV